jgi:hypothetical protein
MASPQIVFIIPFPPRAAAWPAVSLKSQRPIVSVVGPFLIVLVALVRHAQAREAS